MPTTYPVPQTSTMGSPRWWGQGTGVTKAEVLHGLPKGQHLDLAGGRRHFGTSPPREGTRSEVLRNLPNSAMDISLAGGKQHFEPGSSPAKSTSMTSIMRSPEQQPAATAREVQVASGSLSNRRHYSPDKLRSRSVSLEPRQSETSRDLQILDHRQKLGRTGQSHVSRRQSDGGRARSLSPRADGVQSSPTRELLGRSLSTRCSLGSPCKTFDEQKQPQLCRSPSRRTSLNSSPKRPGSSAVIRHTSVGARPTSPDTNGTSPVRITRRFSGQISPKSTLSGNSPTMQRSSTTCLSSTVEEPGPLVVDEISVVVDDIIRHKMDLAWAAVCQRFNIPYDPKTQSLQSFKSRSISPSKRPSLGSEKPNRPSASGAASSSNSSAHLDHALQRAMKAVPDGLKVGSPAGSPAKEVHYDGPRVIAPVKEAASSPPQQHVGHTDQLNYHTPTMPIRHRRRSEPMQGKNTAGSKAQLFISNAALLK